MEALEDFRSTGHRAIWRRLMIASLVVLLLHLLFFGVIAPRLSFETARQTQTEVIQISPQELNRLKERVLKNQQLTPLMRDEAHERYRSETPPADARMMGPHNQIVPREKVAGAQNEAPRQGGGQAGPKLEQRRFDLSKLGLGSKVAPPADATPSGPPGPRAEHRPLGRESRDLEKGDENLLNAIENTHYSFFTRFFEPIVRNWYFLLSQHELELQSSINNKKYPIGTRLPCTVEFVIDRAGNFKRISIVESSGIKLLDRVTVDSVRKLGSIPNPPGDLFNGKDEFTQQLPFGVIIVEQRSVKVRVGDDR